MDNQNSHNQAIPVFIRRRMPNASEEELRKATENVRCYLAVAWRIFERRERERLGPDSPSAYPNDTIQAVDTNSLNV